MGTKLNPGKFDCYDRAAPDEPMFVLLARDPIAPFLVSIWASIRTGDGEAALAKFQRLWADHLNRYALDPDVDKAGEALECAMAMFAWAKEHAHG